MKKRSPVELLSDLERFSTYFTLSKSPFFFLSKYIFIQFLDWNQLLKMSKHGRKIANWKVGLEPIRHLPL